MTGLTYAVTGVASSIGAKLARSLTRPGHRFIGFDIRETCDSVYRFILSDL
ncbi:MAG: hypothetical protein V3U65_10285 [Granulosicoccaceae bacterium]